jgi:hypothetical protein
MIFDEVFNTLEEKPVNVIGSIDDVYPMGSLCKVRLAPYSDSDFGAYLRADMRIRIDPELYRDKKNIFFVSGKPAKM